MTTRKIRLFYSYAHEDEALRQQLGNHLSALPQELIEDWHDRNISAGKEWEREIGTHLEGADIILLLISSDFMASRYCYSSEGKRALERHEAGEARVIPILLRPFDWQDTPLAKLQALPHDGRPVTLWPDRDEAFVDIAQGIHTVIDELLAAGQNDASTGATGGANAQDNGTASHHPAQERPWNVPYRQNPFFTDREQTLASLRERLVREGTATSTRPLAMSGLGGVGKTQIALQYAFRHREQYSAVFWASAATLESLRGDFVKIATLLNLAEKDAPKQDLTIEAVRRWLAHERDWLLIIDNADDLLPGIRPFLPDMSQSNGHILITSRDPVAGDLAEPFEVPQMDREEGMLLLLLRARLIRRDEGHSQTIAELLAQATDEDRAQAGTIVDLLGGLPLALDQAGAYIEEDGCSLARYQELYRKRRRRLLRWLSRFSSDSDYPRTVATTWDLSFQQVEAASPAAAELLRFCAFLDFDAIPEVILMIGASELGPILAPVAADPYDLEEAVQALRRYSLLRRDPATTTLTIHRLVQAVLLDRMDEATQRMWVERALRALNLAFPYGSDNYLNWPLCQRLLPHIQVCANFVDQYALFSVAANRLFHRAGVYLYERALYEQAEVFFKRALLIGEKVDGPEDPNTAATLQQLASLYQNTAQYGQAEDLYRRALAICEKSLGPEHLATAAILHELARLYQNKGRYRQAEVLYQRALRIKEHTEGPDDPDTATTLHELARLYQAQAQYDKAEELYKRALHIKEKSLGVEHFSTASTLGSLGELSELRGEHEQAEDYYKRALAIFGRVPGDEYPATLTVLKNYARFLRKIGRDKAAEEMERRLKLAGRASIINVARF